MYRLWQGEAAYQSVQAMAGGGSLPECAGYGKGRQPTRVCRLWQGEAAYQSVQAMAGEAAYGYGRGEGEAAYQSVQAMAGEAAYGYGRGEGEAAYQCKGVARIAPVLDVTELPMAQNLIGGDKDYVIITSEINTQVLGRCIHIHTYIHTHSKS